MTSGVLDQGHLAHALKQNTMARGVCGWGSVWLRTIYFLVNGKESVGQMIAKDKL